MRGQIARDPDHSVQIQSGSMDPLAAYSGSADPLAAYFMHFPFCASPHMVVPYIIVSMSSRYASSKPPQMYKCRYAYLRYYLSHIVATCEISESAVAYLCRKLYIGSRKKQVDLSVYCSARDMWACDHVPCDIYVQPILWQYDAGFSYMV